MAPRRSLPRSKGELDDREAAGLWKAIALSKDLGESDERITLESVLRVHSVLLANALPQAAGRFRADGEDVKKLKCMEPPPGRVVQERMFAFWQDLDARISSIPRHPMQNTKSYMRTWREEVIDLAAWTQYQIAAIHPFCEGNGRMARLMTNVILRRFGLRPTSVKYEGEDRNTYLSALCQIDRHGDYDPLKKLIIKGILRTYEKERRMRLNAKS